MEKWNRWQPLETMVGKYYVDFLILSENALIIKLSNGEQKIEIIFDESIDAFRYTDESFYFKIFGDLSERYGDDFYVGWSFFKVTNSDYLKWLSEQSCSLTNEFSFIHFCIFGGDKVIDVLARYEPKVKFIE